MPAEAYYNLALCVASSRCVPPLQPLDYTAILTLPPAPENNAGQKTAGTTAHLLTGSSGYRHKRAVASVPLASPYYGKRAAQVYQGLLEEKDHLFGKRSAAVYLEVDESNADNFLGKREAPYFWGKREAPRYPYKRDAARYPYKREFDGSNADNVYGHYYGKREAPGYPYKREAARYPYKRSAAESLEVDESNADYDLGKEEAPAYPYKAALAGPSASRHHIGKRSVPADAHQQKHSFVLG